MNELQKLIFLRGLTVREVAKQIGHGYHITQKVVKGTRRTLRNGGTYIYSNRAIETAVAELLGLTHDEAWGKKSSTRLRQLIRQEIKKQGRKREHELQQQFLCTSRIPEKRPWAMSKRKKRIDRRQASLFDLLRRCAADQSSTTLEGELNIADRLRVALVAAIKQCPRSRHQIAGEMSHLLGHEVSKTTIDTWTAESKERNRIPAEYLPAFCRVTGDREPIRLLAEHGDMFAMPGPEALRAEIQKFNEQECKARAEKRKRMRFLEEMESGR